MLATEQKSALRTRAEKRHLKRSTVRTDRHNARLMLRDLANDPRDLETGEPVTLTYIRAPRGWDSV